LSEQAIVVDCDPQLGHWINIKWFNCGLWHMHLHGELTFANPKGWHLKVPPSLFDNKFIS